jgi:glycosyltransferase involved in cell wall biosynthesis
MKIKIQQFLGTNHSWRFVGENIARALIKQNHDVHLFSTNGLDKFPKDLLPYLRDSKTVEDMTPWKNIDAEYDMQLSYTAMKNFPIYLANGKKNRFAIWNYETTILPEGFTKYHKFCDLMLPSSEFSKKIFADNGVPEEKLVVVPHGINVEEYSNKEIYPLKTKKKFKILSNIAQPHIRKNIPGLFEAYGKAFTKDDDVCLVCKIAVKKPVITNVPKQVRSQRAAKKLNEKKPSENQEKKMAFNIDFWRIYNDFCKKYPKHAEVEIITEFLDTMTPLYNACDIAFSMTRAECFWLIGIEAFSTSNLVISPRYGGQLDFLNDNNSLLIEGKVIRAPKEMQYWTDSPLAEMFEPDIEDAVSKLKYAVNNYDMLMQKFGPGIKEQLNRLTWDNVATQIIGLCK